VIPNYVFDTGALISAERGKERAARFLRLVRLTLDAIVIATAALSDAIVVTGDPADFARLAPHFPKVAVLSA
jgi:predicted nucleic acid-binding protein